MDKISEEEIIQFLKEEALENEIVSETDIFKNFGISGDDCDELLGAFQKKYDVDMSEYLWYFHHQEEGNNIAGSFFKSPDERVKRIPITPKMLTGFANSNKWKIDYPDHSLPKYRYDLAINSILLVLILGCLVYTLINKYL